MTETTDPPAPPPEDDGVRVRPFSDWVREQRRGHLHNEISAKMQEVALAVMEHGKKGSVTITIEFARSKSHGMLDITDRVTKKEPEGERGGSYFYVDKHGNLVGSDPNQMTFDSLRVVEETGEAVRLDERTGEVRRIGAE